MLKETDKLPTFTLENQNGDTINSSELSGKKLVLYFYPKDDTPGCTLEAIDFTTFKAEFDAKNTHIIGVSKDSVQKHEKFCNKHNLAIELLSDPEGSLIEACGAWQEKNLYGRKYMGIVRSTFLFDENQTLIKAWPKVKAKGHAQEVLNTI